MGSALDASQVALVLDRLTVLPPPVRRDLESECEHMIDRGDTDGTAALIALLDDLDARFEDLEPDGTDCGNAEDDCMALDLGRYPFSLI